MRGCVQSRRAGERGQAAVETAIVMPLMVFFVLGVLQLTMIQHARLMMEYAAFNAARAGAVWNADRGKMTSAALYTLLPTMGAVNTVFPSETPLGPTDGLVVTWVKMYLLVKATGAISDVAVSVSDLLTQFGIAVPGALGAVAQASFLRVNIINPTRANFRAGETEIDFDDPSRRTDTQLTIRVNYLYQLKVPFANWIIYQAFLSQLAGGVLRGAIDRPQDDLGNIAVSGSAADAAMMARVNIDQQQANYRGYNADLLRMLYEIGNVTRNSSLGAWYLLPLQASYTMRMQSNPYRDSLPDQPELIRL